MPDLIYEVRNHNVEPTKLMTDEFRNRDIYRDATQAIRRHDVARTTRRRVGMVPELGMGFGAGISRQSSADTSGA